MKVRIRQIMVGIKEAFHPLPTREELEVNFPHTEACVRISGFEAKEILVLLPSGVMCNSVVVIRRSLVCPDCKTSQLFR